VALWVELVRAFSALGAVVYEPFSGSGTTLIACEQLERACRAIEIEPSYVQMAIDRWEAFTGQKAVKVAAP
jgi:DNA modification methylase